MTEVILGAVGFATLFGLFVVLPGRLQRETEEDELKTKTG